MEDKLEKMKKKSDLSDIILEKEGSSNEKIKKMLLIVASLVLLFLVILIAMKLFNNPNISPSENLADINQNIQTAESKGEEKVAEAVGAAPTTATDEGKNALFKEEPIIDEGSETDQKFEEMVRKLKQQDALENQGVTPQETRDLNATSTAKLSGDENITTTDAKVADVVDKIKDVATLPTTPKAQTAPTEKPTAEKTAVGEMFSEAKEVPAPKKERAPVASAGTSSSGYFIQVGATAQAFPDQKFLAKIKNSGYDYVIQKSNVKGQVIKKVLIGPFSSRDQARNELGGVQTKINPNAYIYKVN